MKTKGFTLIEMMIVIAVLAIFLVLVVGGARKSKSITRDNIRVSGIQEIRLALEEYKFKCREYPASLYSSANNGDCPNGFTLGDIITLPVSPEYNEEPEFYSEVSYTQTYNGYYYAGLSTRSAGPCFEYHLGIPLESPREDSGDYLIDNEFFQRDHDCGDLQGVFDHACFTSRFDFPEADDDQTYGVYDYRSANNC